MKSEITSLDLHYLAKELEAALVGARVDKIYQQEEDSTGLDPSIQKKQNFSDKKEFLFTFHKTGTGKLMLRIKLPNFLYLTEIKQEFPETPPGFCTFLRKHIGSGKITGVRQKYFERILELDFDTKEGKRILICELFSKGNMILVDETMKIKGLLESQNWQSRTIRGGATYEYPPKQENVLQLDENGIALVLKNTKMESIVKALAVDFSLGGVYAEYICKKIDVDKNEKPIDADSKKIYSEIMMLANNPFACKIGEEVFPVKIIEPDKTFESFNKALDETLTQKTIGSKEAKEQNQSKSKLQKTEKVIEKQKERAAELEKTIVENQRKGELIYEHYTEVKELLEKINLDRKKMSWEDLKKKYSKIEILEKEGKIVIDL